MIDDCPETLLEAARYFADLDVCNEYMKSIKWPRGIITCPHCQAKGDRIGEITTRRMLRCKDCQTQFTARLGTVFSDSPLPLGHWFTAVWCVANGDTISSPVLAQCLGVTQKTAWFLLNRIRIASQMTH
jgi:transposase-like protein